MIPARQVDREAHIAEILLKSEAALGELHQYYKFGRHEGTFAEKPYFLLSHCAHLLFSLWLTENESPAGLFEYSSCLNTLISNLDFGALRYTDYKRRALHADALQEHMKNEPKWFQFWLAALEKQDGIKPPDCQEFSQNVLTYVSHPGFLEGKVSKKSRKTLTGFMKTDTVARIFCRSMSVLEEMIAAVVFRFTNLDQSRHTSKHLASLICMFRQIRRMIVSETPAQGPYVLLSNKNWGTPSTLFRMYGGRMRGILKVVPKRDGGSIVCSYRWTSGSQSKRRSWTRDTAALRHPYEEGLFKTWSYDTGERLHNPEPSTDAKAYWLIQNTEARRLKAVFRIIETVQRTLALNPLCHGLTADIARLSMDNQADWQGARLTWTYIEKLDQLLSKLTFAYREARVLGGNNPGEEVISNMWPPLPSVCEPAERSEPYEPEVTEPSQESPSPTAPSQLEPTETTRVEAHSPQGSVAETEQTPPIEPTTMESCESTDSTKPHDQTFPSTLQPLVTSQETGHLDDEAEQTQEPLEAFATGEQEEYDSASLSQDEISDSPQEEQEQPIVAEWPVRESDPQAESQEASYQIPAPTGPAAEDLISPEPEARTDQVGDTEEIEEAVGHIDDEAEARQEPLEAPATGGQEAVRMVSEPHLQSDQSPDKPKEHDLESVAEKADTTRSPISEPSEQGKEDALEATNLTSEPRPKASGVLLRQKLLQWHHPVDGPVSYDALPLKQLQQELKWTPSEVQRMMTSIFGRRPFTVYKGKCKDKTVCDFLEDSTNTQTEPQESQPGDSPSRAPNAIAVSDRMFCEYISQKPQTSVETIQEPTDTECGIVVETPESCKQEATEPADKTNRTDAYHQLLDRLLEHHHVPIGPVRDDPVSLKQLQQDLGWTPAEVQRTMTHLFGRRPFTAYKKQCGEGMIGDFLEDCDRRRLDKADSQHRAVRQHAPRAL